jgi:outer membrane receptor protein involved in Fe transport
VEQDLGLVIDVLPTPAGSLITRKAPAPGFRPETLRSYESGFRQQIGSKVSLDTSLFYNRYNDLEALVNGPMYFDSAARSLAMDIQSANLASAAGYGAEVAIRADVTYRWRITASTTNYRSRVTTTLSPEAGRAKPDIFPRRQFQLLSTYNVTRRTQFNTVWYHTGATPAAQQVPTHNRLDFGIRWRASEWAGLAFGIQNLFNHSLLDYRPEDGASPQYMRRTAYIRLQWWF